MYSQNEITMSVQTHKIKIIHEKFGVLLEETFVDPIQFKLFLKMIDGCITLKNDLTFFNGVDFFVNIPKKILVQCIVVTNKNNYTLVDHLITKSQIEAPVTK